MTIALTVAAVSLPGLLVAWRLLRPPARRARDMPLVLDEPDGVRFGFDSRGLVS